MTDPDPQPIRLWETRSVGFVIRVVVFALAILIALVLYEWLIDSEPAQPSEIPTPPVFYLPGYVQEQATVLKRADDAVMAAERATDSADRVMNFIQAASILAAVMLGAAAIYGFRNAQETRKELKEEMAELKALRAEIEANRENLRKLPDSLKTIDGFKNSLDTLDQSFANLVQANHELQLRNYQEAYTAICRVLDRDQNNVLALYFAGLLELQYVPDAQERGMEHLKRAWELDRDWPSAMAAYGVVLRRQGRKATGKTRVALIAQAKGLLQQALGKNPNLLDLNRESFWGPMGGMLRDEDDFTGARKAYEEACRVTPGSSYPHGNLAALYLREASNGAGNNNRGAQALEQFNITRNLAQAELSQEPNDYFLMMDVVMSSIILGQREPMEFDEGRKQLTATLAMPGTTTEMLDVSRRGWLFLLESCPTGDEWHDVRINLLGSLQKVHWAFFNSDLNSPSPDEPNTKAFEEIVNALETVPNVPAATLQDWQQEWANLSARIPATWTATQQHIQTALTLINTTLADRQADSNGA